MVGDGRGSGRLRTSRLLSSRGLGRSGRARRTRATLRFSRQRTTQEARMRDIASSSWDDGPPSPSSAASPVRSRAPSPDACGVGQSATAFATASGLPVPLLRPTPPGTRWSTDCISVVHNAVLCEIGALYDILASMLLGCASRRASAGELRAFFAWFATFEAFVVTVLKAEEEVLYPWLEQWGRIEGALSTGARIAAKGAVIRGVRDASACAVRLGMRRATASALMAGGERNYHDALQVGFAEMGPSEDENAQCEEVLTEVARHVSGFTRALAAYFREQEDALPKIIEGLYDAEDVRSSAFERRTLRAIWKSGRKDEATLILVKGFGDHHEMARCWIQRNLRRIDRMSLPLWRRRYVAGRGAVLARFRARKKRSEQLLELHGTPEGRDRAEEKHALAAAKLSLPYSRNPNNVFRTLSNR